MSLSDTLIGPAPEAIVKLAEILQKARDSALTLDDKLTLADIINFGAWNNPVAPLNLFYVRPALDYLFLNSMREIASPGYLKRANKRRRRDYDQDIITGRYFGS